MDKGLIYRNTVFNVKTARRNPESNTKGFFALIKIEKKKKPSLSLVNNKIQTNFKKSHTYSKQQYCLA